MISTSKSRSRVNRPAAERRPEKIADKTLRVNAPIFPNSKRADTRFCWEFVLQNVSIRDKGKKKNKKCAKRAGPGVRGWEPEKLKG
jgi:hypothetical protein